MKKHLLLLGVTFIAGLILGYSDLVIASASASASALIPALGGLFVAMRLNDRNIDTESEVKHLTSVREDLNDHIEGLVRVLDSKDVVISEMSKENELLKKEVDKWMKVVAETEAAKAPVKKATKTTTKKTTTAKKTK